jgi:hypothetical protein
LKKSESLEIRLPYPTKLAFMAACRDRDVSASEALRRFIDAELSAAPISRPSRRSWRPIVGTAIAVLVGAAALPSLAHTGLRSEFDRLDANRDGVVSVEEFSRLDTNRDGRITFAEFKALPGR